MVRVRVRTIPRKLHLVNFCYLFIVCFPLKKCMHLENRVKTLKLKSLPKLHLCLVLLLHFKKSYQFQVLWIIERRAKNSLCSKQASLCKRYASFLEREIIFPSDRRETLHYITYTFTMYFYSQVFVPCEDHGPISALRPKTLAASILIPRKNLAPAI